MDNTDTPTKTPFRRLGLVRSIRGTKSEESHQNTPKLNAATTEQCDLTSEGVTTPTGMHPIRSTCSVDNTSDLEDTPTTPANSRSSLKRTRLSLSRTWKDKIIIKKDQQRMKRRKLLKDDEPEEVATSSTAKVEPQNCVDSGNVSPQSEISTTKRKIKEIKENISIWREGCIKALTDLQQQRDVGDMESLLKVMHIPHELVGYDRTNQIFLDPD